MPSNPRDDSARPGRVLVVDDMDMVRTALARQFEHLGCEVGMAANGSEALELIRTSSTGWDLVVSDQTMPGMSGEDLLARLRESCPGIHTVLLSGWGPLHCEAADRILHKPPRIEDLRALLSEFVRRPPEADGDADQPG